MSLHDALLAKAFGGGSGGASSWNDLTDKPFGEEAVQIIWKAATDVTDYVTPHSQRNVFYKITDEVFDISDLDGAYFIVDMGNGSTTKVDLNNVKEIQGGCSQGNAFCSIYDTIVNLGIASDGKPDTFPSTGTYLGMSRPYDVQIVIPKRIKKIDDKYLPDIGGGADIDVTAQVGQTIIVKDVDASGKPTKWESADYQPRTHWSEFREVQPSTTITPFYYEALGVPMGNMSNFDIVVGNKYKVIFDGVEYTCEAFIASMAGMSAPAFGNTAVAGGANTGEPFAIFKMAGDNWVTAIFFDMNPHTVQVFVETATPIPEKYLGNAFPYHIDAVGDWDGIANGEFTSITFNNAATDVINAFNRGREIKLRLHVLKNGEEKGYLDVIYDMYMGGTCSEWERSVFMFVRHKVDEGGFILNVFNQAPVPELIPITVLEDGSLGVIDLGE